MKKINLKGINEILSEKELKNVMGGSSGNGCATNSCSSGQECCYPAYNWCVNGFCQTRR